MNVQQLKKFLSDLPDDMILCIGTDNGDYLINNMEASFAENVLYFSETKQ